tara:strand:+ start:7308 stop:7841 length:534 start_codon:yes stop_codon:yes gene_type:complete
MHATSANTLPLPIRTKLLLAPLLLLAACSTAPAPHASQAQPAAPLAVYPSAGQSPEQISRDRYDCHLWAVQQSHFDPATMSGDNASLPVPASPGHNTAAGAVVGGVAGAILSGPHHGGEGALVGAVMGAVVGAAGDANEADRIEAINAERAAQQSLTEGGYQRALEACLVGRGYSVR